MSTAKAKGDALEYAVHRIEEVLFESTPGLAGTKATIERKKRFQRGEAAHEVDLWITRDAGTDFASHVLIECKNWSEPVGQEVVLAVRSKRDILGAEKAIIIARDFTKGATATAAESRIVLTRVSDDFLSPLDAVQWVFTTHEPLNPNFTVQFYDQIPDSMLKLDYERSFFRWDKRVGRLGALLWPQIEAHFRDVNRRDPRGALEGIHFGRTGFGWSFERGELFINDLEVSNYTVTTDYVVEVLHAKVDVKFSVAGHGGFHRLVCPPGMLETSDVAIEIVAKPHQNT